MADGDRESNHPKHFWASASFPTSKLPVRISTLTGFIIRAETTVRAFDVPGKEGKSSSRLQVFLGNTRSKCSSFVIAIIHRQKPAELEQKSEVFLEPKSEGFGLLLSSLNFPSSQ